MECLYFQHCILDYYSYQIWKSIPRVPSDIQIYPKENIHLGALLHKLPSTIWIHLTSWKYFWVSIKNYMVTKSQVQWVTKISEFFRQIETFFFRIIFDVFFFFRVQEILAELQFSFVCFLVGQHYDSFEQWKKLLIMLCTCEDAILEHSQLYMNLISELYFQVITYLVFQFHTKK